MNGQQKIFSLNGQIGRAENTDKLLIGDLIDKTSNFNVIYFGISSKPSDITISNKKINKIKNNFNNILCLYLQEKGTRNMIMIEVPNIQLINIEKLFKESKNLKKCNHIDQFWYSKILKPIKKEEIDIDSSNEVRATTQNTNTASNAKLALGPVSSDTTYTYTFNVFGENVVESFTVRHYVDGPGIMYNQGLFPTKLKIVDEKTTCSTNSSYNSTDTNFKLGWYQDTNVEAYTAIGDYFQTVAWDGKYYVSGTISMSISWGYADPKTGIGFAVSYQPVEVHNAHTFKNFDNTSSTKVRQAKITWVKQKHQLININQEFDQNFTIAKYSDPGTKNFNVKFTYDISNGLDYSYGGLKIKTITYSYTCK